MLWFAAMGVALLAIAWAAPAIDRPTDRDTYEATASRFIVPDCSDLHCFRVLVPWMLGPLPGSSTVKWKVYAAVANLFAAIAVYALAQAWGLSTRGAAMASAMSAFGCGSLYTLFDSFTADPLMYAIGPAIVWLLLHDRLAVAAAAASIGVMAKEFAAAPMLMFSAAAFAAGRIAESFRILAFANVALIVWLILQLVLMIGFNYSYVGNPSTHLTSGGYLAFWLSRQSWALSALAIFGEYGMMWLLMPVGWWLAPPKLRQFALVAMPFAAVFLYVQQPDRALWNFHFLVTPLAALALERAPASAAWACIALYATANLRLGAQLPHLPPSRVSLVLATVIAIGCLATLRPAAPKAVAA